MFDRVTDQDYESESSQFDVTEEQSKLSKLLSMSVSQIELSVRTANCLNNANIQSVGELVTKQEQEMLMYRNFGETSRNEIKKKLEALGLSLGMKYGKSLVGTQKESHVSDQSLLPPVR